MVKVSGAMFPSTWTMVAPIIATFSGYLFLGEELTLFVLLGTVVTMAGIVLVNRRELFPLFSSRQQTVTGIRRKSTGLP